MRLHAKRAARAESKTRLYSAIASTFLFVASLLLALACTCENPASAAVPFLRGVLISESLRELLLLEIYVVSRNVISKYLSRFRFFITFGTDISQKY